MKRLEPEAGDAESGEIIEAPRQALEISDAVSAGIHECADVEAVNDGVLIPEVVDH